MEKFIVLLIIAIPLILVSTIQWIKTQKKRIGLAKHQALIIEDEIRSNYCSKCPYCKEAGGNDEFIIFVRKKHRYVFYTYSCVAHNLGHIQCYYNTAINSILHDNIFDLWKNSGAGAGWDCSNDRIHYAIDYDELLDNSNKIYSTSDKNREAIL